METWLLINCLWWGRPGGISNTQGEVVACAQLHRHLLLLCQTFYKFHYSQSFSILRAKSFWSDFQHGVKETNNIKPKSVLSNWMLCGLNKRPRIPQNSTGILGGVPHGGWDGALSCLIVSHWDKGQLQKFETFKWWILGAFDSSIFFSYMYWVEIIKSLANILSLYLPLWMNELCTCF